MNKVAGQFAIPGDKCEHWKGTHAHAVRDALNNHSNNTSQDLKRELSGKCNDGVTWLMSGLILNQCLIVVL
jgi:hypothetical protein